MAKYQVLAVRDLAVSGYGQPIFVAHVGQALRGFTDETRRKDSPIALHPEDFELWHVAEFDDTDGQFVNLAPERIARAVDLVRSS